MQHRVDISVKNKSFFLYRITGALLLLFFFFNSVYSQVHMRIEADFSIKEKFADGSQKLTMGRMYYDRNYQKIVYNIKFPEKEILVMTDSSVIQIRNNKIYKQSKSVNIVKLSIFNLSLEGSLPYYGLKDSPFQLINIEEDSNMVITTWETLKLKSGNYSKVLLSQVDKKLNGLITYDALDNMISKQLFEDYTKVSGLDFPTKVIQFFHFGGAEQIKMVNFSNIIINNLKNEEFYNYTIPSN